MNIRIFYTLPLLLCTFFSVLAQQMPVDDIRLSRQHAFIQPASNQIRYGGELDSFFHRLSQVKSSGSGQVTIVHIGDSHIQAGFLPGTVRNGLQQFFGNAGRGLVFPYQLAKSNAPVDISSQSVTAWQFNRLAHPEIALPFGVSGYGISSDQAASSFSLSLRPDNGKVQQFDRIRLFTAPPAAADEQTWKMHVSPGDSVIISSNGNQGISHEIILKAPTSSFSISATGPGWKRFYGASLETGQSGVLYQTIGINGARYDHFNVADLFWAQLSGLTADLVIVSLGTNEAQNSSFNENGFLGQVRMLVDKIRSVFPRAAILLTTAADSFKSRKPNAVLNKINTALATFCQQSGIPLWDLYRITGGYGSANGWYRQHLMSRDRIHFTAEGYKIQGTLLLNAIAKGYNDYAARDR